MDREDRQQRRPDTREHRPRNGKYYLPLTQVQYANHSQMPTARALAPHKPAIAAITTTEDVSARPTEVLLVEVEEAVEAEVGEEAAHRINTNSMSETFNAETETGKGAAVHNRRKIPGIITTKTTLPRSLRRQRKSIFLH